MGAESASILIKIFLGGQTIMSISVHKALTLLLSMCFIITLISFLPTTTLAAGSVLDQIESTAGGVDGDQVKNEIDEGAYNLIRTVRGIAILIAFVMVVILGFALFSGGARRLADYKIWAVVFVLAIFLIFKTEAILSTIFSIFGVDISQYS